MLSKLSVPDTLYFMIFSKRFLLLGGSALMLGVAGCSHPNAMPSGYTHHHENYKSPNEVSSLSPVFLERLTGTPVPLSVASIDGAVDDMIRKITARAGAAPKPVFIIKPSQKSAFYNAMDNALRVSMRDLGYAISDTTSNAYAISYSARNLMKPRGTENDGNPNVEMILQIFSNPNSDATLLAEQSGNYFIEGAERYTIRPFIFKRSTTSEPEVESPAPELTPLAQQTSLPLMDPMPSFEMPDLIEMEEPITPDIDFQSLSSESVSSAYEDNNLVNTRPAMTETLMSGRVSKPVDY